MINKNKKLMYGLRKISKNNKNEFFDEIDEFNDYDWPLEVGKRINKTPPKRGDLYCLLNAKGNWNLLSGEYWAVLEFDEKDMVLIDNEKCKVKKCKIIFLSENPEGMLKFFDHEKFDSATAFKWASFVGNKDIMISKISESRWAYVWAKDIGNEDIMIDRITDSFWAYFWAKNIGNQDIMINKITDPKMAFYWAKFHGNKDVMIDRITEPQWAYEWAKDIGNQDIMIDRITESEWAFNWAIFIGNKDIMIDRITESEWAYFWLINIGNRDELFAKFPNLPNRLVFR